MKLIKSSDFIIESANQKINILLQELKDKKSLKKDNTDDTYKKIDNTISFLEDYVNSLEDKKKALEEDINVIKSFMDDKIRQIHHEYEDVSSLSKHDNVKGSHDINDSINKINFDLYKASQKVKDIKDSIDIHIKNVNSFIENKNQAILNSIKESKEKGNVESNKENTNNNEQVTLSSDEFCHLVRELNDKGAEVITINGYTSDNQTLYINDNMKIRPPVNVIERENLSVTVLDGKVKSFDGVDFSFNSIHSEINEVNKEVPVDENNDDGVPHSVERVNKDGFLNSLMEADRLPSITNRKFFSVMRLDNEVFFEMIDKIHENNFKIVDIVAKTKENDVVSASLSRDNTNINLLKGKGSVIIEKAVVSTPSGEIISMMEALILLD